MECLDCHHENSEEARFCAYCGTSLNNRQSRPDRPLSFPPRLAQRRLVTVSMSDLCGYTELNEALDPEDVAAIMRTIKVQASAIVERHGGMINQFVGDEIVALFGVPAANEDDPRRAVTAAAELHAAVKALEGPAVWARRQLLLHTGIDHGLVHVDSHDPRAGVYELTGDAINLAARLRSKAAPDELIISESVARGVTNFFVTEQLEPLEIKGKLERVAAYRVMGSNGTQSRFEVAQHRGLTPFCGRERELAALESRVERARSGTGQLVVIAGDSGIGKTRLIHEFVERSSSSALIVRGECSAYGSAAPYQVLVGVVRKLLDIVAKDVAMSEAVQRDLEISDPNLFRKLPALLHLLGWQTGVTEELAGESLQRAVAEAVAELFNAASKRETTIVILDDWHWADEGSRQLLWQISRLIAHAPLVVLLSHRPGAATNELAANLRLRLEALSRECTSDMTQAVLACEALSPRLLARIHDHTEGNPFFVEEFCRSLREEGFPSTGLPADLHIPEGVQAVVRARLDRLSERDADVLRHASIFGEDFGARHLSQLLSDSHDLPQVLERLSQLGLLRCTSLEPEPVYQFKHAITRDVTYETLLVRQRRELHAAVARLLEADSEMDPRKLEERIEPLAYHYCASKLHRRAAQYTELAGDKASRSYSLDQARQQYRAAIEHLDELEESAELFKRRVDVSLKWAQACLFKPAFEQLDVLRVSYDRAVRIEYTRGAARMLYWMGWLEYALGNQQEAIEYLNRCMALAEQTSDDRLIAQLHLNLGQSFAAATEYRQALRWLNLGIGLKRERGSNPPDAGGSGASYGGGGLAYSLGYLALIHGDIGQFESAYTELEIALSMVRARGTLSLEGSITTQLGMVQLWQGDFEKSLQTAARMQEIGEQVNGPYILAMSQTIAGYANCHLGQRDAGLLQLREAAHWLKTHEIKLTLSWNFACLAEALALAGRFEEARDAANHALERARTWDRLGEVMAHRALGIAESREGNHELAHTHFGNALSRATAKESPRDMAITCLRWSDALAHSPERARNMCSEALIFFEGAQMQFHAELTRARLDELSNELMPTRIEHLR